MRLKIQLVTKKLFTAVETLRRFQEWPFFLQFAQSSSLKEAEVGVFRVLFFAVWNPLQNAQGRRTTELSSQN